MNITSRVVIIWLEMIMNYLKYIRELRKFWSKEIMPCNNSCYNKGFYYNFLKDMSL